MVKFEFAEQKPPVRKPWTIYLNKNILDIICMKTIYCCHWPETAPHMRNARRLSEPLRARKTTTSVWLSESHVYVLIILQLSTATCRNKKDNSNILSWLKSKYPSDSLDNVHGLFISSNTQQFRWHMGNF